ncbi:MAG TPA: efflux RND transporter periplasmic adaptor subunit [Thermodesulfobacteriota bacterium]|nr:efflux RND transporter periplasmic adaptor subunit [Thermodesulfobacteriota bacterium]
MKILDKKTVVIIAILLIVVVYLAYRIFQNEATSIAYKTAKVDKGDIISYVTATGTLNPISTIEIGSQVSGTIKNIFVDFNSVVKKGDPLSEIDPTPFNSQLKQAHADLKKAEADAEIAKTLQRANEVLYKKRLISKEEYDDSRAKYSSAIATLEQRKAALEITKANLDNTSIRSPIDGIVISRKINISQIVTSGQSSSPLFLIAEDLSRMKLDAHVSEADIGRVKNEQEAEFTVDAYPNQTFKGKVWQIKNEPITTNNVITYDVVILIDNNDLKLKPGMTAEVKILVAHKRDVLRVPTAALRFIPPPYAPVDEGFIELNNTSVVWVPLKNGRLKAVSINPGVSDEAFTEILDGNLGEGEKVIVEATENTGTGSEPLGPIVLPKPQRF